MGVATATTSPCQTAGIRSPSRIAALPDSKGPL